MSDEAATRTSHRWLRLHRSTWVILLLATAALALIIVPGENTEIAGFFGGGDVFRYEHGWPCVFLRHEIQPVVDPFGDNLSLPWGGPWLQRGAWSTDGSGVASSDFSDGKTPGWRPWMLAFDLLAAATILVLMAFALEWRRRHRRLWQFSLADMLGLMLLAGIVLGWWMVNLRTAQAEQRFASRPVQQGESTVERASYESRYRGPVWLRRAVGVAIARAFWRVVHYVVEESDHDRLPALPEALPNIEVLNLSLVPISDGDLRHVGRLRKLTALYIDSAFVTDQGLSHLSELSSLETLDLKTPLVTDAGLAQLSRLSNLRRLSIADCRGVTNAGLRHLTSLKQLELLTLSGGLPVDNQGAESISQLKNLKQLSLTAPSIDRQGLRLLATLHQLRMLSLQETSFSKEDLRELLRCEQLEHLHLEGVSINGRAAIERFIMEDE